MRCEITPPDNNFDAALDTWNFKTDQDELPIWYDSTDAEAECRKELINWLSSNVVLTNQMIASCDKYIVACFGTIEAVWGGTIEAVRGGTIKDVWGGTIKDVWGGTIEAVRGGTIKAVWGNATITITNKDIDITPKENVVIIDRSGKDVVVHTAKGTSK